MCRLVAGKQACLLPQMGKGTAPKRFLCHSRQCAGCCTSCQLPSISGDIAQACRCAQNHLHHFSGVDLLCCIGPELYILFPLWSALIAPFCQSVQRAIGEEKAYTFLAAPGVEPTGKTGQ